MKDLTIDIHSLKKAMDLIFNKLADNGNTSIAIPNDYYLTIPMDEAYNLEDEIKPSVGSLFDDWENLNKVINNLQPVTFVDFDRLAAILNAISQELNPPLKSINNTD